jgi:hypothetical protein
VSFEYSAQGPGRAWLCDASACRGTRENDATTSGSLSSGRFSG